MAQVDKCAMKVFLDNLDVLLERDVVLDVVLCKLHPDDEGLVELFVHFDVVPNEVLPDLSTDLSWDTFAKSISETATGWQVDRGPDLRQPAIDPLLEGRLVLGLAEDHLVDLVFEARGDLVSV